MARLFLLTFLILLPLFMAAATSAPFPHNKLKEKLSHLHFYQHETTGSRNATAVPVAKPLPSSPPSSAFGLIMMMDDQLIEGPDLNSKPLGRSQGFYAASAQEELGLLMAMNLVFTAGPYNGSVLTVLGRNPPARPVREMAVVGGSGHFRFARGYAQLRTHWLNAASNDAILELDVHVMHY